LDAGARRKYTLFRRIAPFQVREARAFPPEPSASRLQTIGMGIAPRALGFFSLR
jgi:FAD/FMN-containing dehydrogenase